MAAAPFPCMLRAQAAGRGFALLSRLGTSRVSASLQELDTNALTHGARHKVLFGSIKEQHPEVLGGYPACHKNTKYCMLRAALLTVL